MTAFIASRGELRAAIGSVLPHVGRESEDTPNLGRMRFHVSAERAMVWATDHQSSALASMTVDEHLDDGADGWDLPASEAKKFLAVFTPPSSPDLRMMWAQEPLRVEVSDSTVTFTELGSFVDGQALTIRRVMPVGDDQYPDVPRIVHHELAPAVFPGRGLAGGMPLVDAVVLARFAAAAKAYGNNGLAFVRILSPDAADVVLIQIGRDFLGTLHRHDDQAGTSYDKTRETARWWTDLVEPLRRPVPVQVSQAITDDLVNQAKAALMSAADANGITFTVTTSAAPE